jgi:hypothetical protein
MKTVAEHYYNVNKKKLRVIYTQNPKKDFGLPPCDVLVLDFNGLKIGIRPDEAIMLINLLSKAVFNTVKSYEMGLLRKMIK